MALFNWNDNYSVKVKDIDNQHRELICILNELYEAMSAKQSEQILGSVVVKLLNYTRQHFSIEEAYMQRVGYPDFAAHKQQHEIFIKKISDFKRDLAAGKLALSVDIAMFLKDWLVKHISGVDKKYTSHFHAKGIV